MTRPARGFHFLVDLLFSRRNQLNRAFRVRAPSGSVLPILSYVFINVEIIGNLWTVLYQRREEQWESTLGVQLCIKNS